MVLSEESEEPPKSARRPIARRRVRLGAISGEWWGFFGYVAVQAFIVAGLPTNLLPDSTTYLQLSLTGNAPQLPTVPLLYWIFPNEALRIAAQTGVAAIAWWVLAAVAARRVRDRRVALGLRGVLLALGIVGPIASWNSMILSESIAISLTALLIAAWLSFLDRPRLRALLAVVAVTILWSYARQYLVVVGLLVTVIAVVGALRHHHEHLRLLLGALLVVVSVGGVVLTERNTTVASGNVSDIIEDRILPNPTWTDWFVSHGMPFSVAIATTPTGSYGQDLDEIPVFSAWVTASGMTTYARFVLEHPRYSLWGPLASFFGERTSLTVPNTSPYATSTQPNPTPSMLSPDANYGRHRDVLPDVVEELLFEQGQAGDVLTLAVIAVALAVVARRRRGPDRRVVFPALVALSAIPQGYFIWLTGGEGELDRLSLVLAVSLRIALWLIVGFSLDHLRSPRPQDAARRQRVLADLEP